MKVSIIVPVYKTEMFLRRCVESLLGQTFGDYEIILINDGSPDGSGYICDGYAEQYSNIKVIHQENQGVSAARNAGISMAAGEWVMFVDSDDWIEPEILEVMLRRAESGADDVDICVSGYIIEAPEGIFRDEFKRLAGHLLSSAEKIELYKRRLIMPAIGGCIEPVRTGVNHAKLYRRNLLQNHGITFRQGIMWNEDRLFNLYAIHYAKTVVLCEGAFYHYVVNLSSASNSYKPGMMESTDKLLCELNVFLKQCFSCDDKNASIIYNNWACMAFLEAVKINYLLVGSPYTFNQGVRAVKALVKYEPFKTALRDIDASSFPRSLRIRRWLLGHRLVLLHNFVMIARFRLKGQ